MMVRTLVYPFSIMELVSLAIPPGLMSRAIEPGVQSLASTLSPSVRYTLACWTRFIVTAILCTQALPYLDWACIVPQISPSGNLHELFFSGAQYYYYYYYYYDHCRISGFRHTVLCVGAIRYIGVVIVGTMFPPCHKLIDSSF
jgi:hypothetical protein